MISSCSTVEPTFKRGVACVDARMMQSPARRVLTVLVVVVFMLGGAAVAVVAPAAQAGALEPVTVVLSSDRNPVPYQQFHTVSVTVTGSGGGVPTGTVDVSIGTNLMETVTLDGNGQASTHEILANVTGDYVFRGSYSGDATFDPGMSEPLVQHVEKAPTTTLVTTSHNPSVYGDAVTLDVTVQADGISLGPGPTGSVAFFQLHGTTRSWLGTALLADAPGTDSTSTTSLETTALRAGTGPVSAVYRSDDGFRASEGIGDQTVIRPVTATTLRTSGNPAFVGDPVTFTARVRNLAAGGVVPSGTVAFFRILPDATRRWIANVTLGGGIAAITLDQLPVGTTRIAAVFRGAPNFGGSETARNQRMTTRTLDPA
jgi:hypothetical protein